MKRDKKTIVIFTMLAINLAVTMFVVIYLFVPVGKQSDGQSNLVFDSVENGQYVLYIGTNDKDTYDQIIPTEQARKIVNEICAKYVDGYTSSEAEGGWVDEKGILTQENTLVYSFANADESAIIAIMNDVLTALNQNSILVERRDISSMFYYGEN